MNKLILLLAIPVSASAIQMASQPWTQNRIRESHDSIMSNVDSIVSNAQESAKDIAWSYATFVAKEATNYTDSSIASIPEPDFTSSNEVLVATIKENAPPPGNYATVSNKAMSAIQAHQSLQPATNYANHVSGLATNYANKVAKDATNYTDKAISEIPDPDFTSSNPILVQTIKDTAPPPGNYSTVSNRAMTALQSHQSLLPATNYANLVALWNTNYTDASISSDNPRFVSAVTNCPVYISADSGSEIGQYGEYGTLGALLAALAAGFAALKRGKVDANAAIEAGTKCKITYDSKGLVTAGADLSEDDIPAIPASKIQDFAEKVAEVSPPTDISGKLDSTAAAKAYSAQASYQVDAYVTYNGVLYQCKAQKAPGETTPDNDIYDDTVTPATGHWIITDMTTPDATLDIMNDGSLRVMSADGDELWRQGYGLGTVSSLELSNETINRYSFSANDTGTVNLVLPKIPAGKVTDFCLDVINPALDSTASGWPSDFSESSTYAVGDKVAYDSKIWRCIEAVSTAGAWADANWEQAFPMLSLGAALDSTVKIVVGEGKSLADIFTVKPGTMVRVWFTLTAFGLGGLPTYLVASMTVEDGGAQT